MAKEAVRGLMTRDFRDKRQQLPLEKVCVFIAGRKQTLDPKKDLKQQIVLDSTEVIMITVLML